MCWPTSGELVGLLAVTALLALAVTAFGVAVASRRRTLEGFGVISSFVVLPLHLLSGGAFPITGLPGWMSVLVHVNPTTHAVDLMRPSSAGSPSPWAVMALALFQRE